MHGMRVKLKLVLPLAVGCLVSAPQLSWPQTHESLLGGVIPQADCALLDDPQMKQKMGTALEMKLKWYCREESQNPVEDLGEDVETEEADTPEGQSDSGYHHDVLVNDPSQDNFPNTTQSETSIVAVRSSICAAWNDSGQLVEGLGFAGFGFSRNKGKTWNDQGAFPPGVGGSDASFGDPSLAFRHKDHAVYYASLSSAGLSMWRSRDGCRTFHYVGPIHVGGGDDKELIAVDNNRHSPYFGRIYVGWTNFLLAGDLNQTSYSDDGGANWSNAVSLPDSGTNGQGMWPAVAPNGDVYFALLDRCNVVGCSQTQRIYKSENGGDTWFEATPIGENQLRPEDVVSTQNCGRQALGDDIRNLSSPQIAIHRDRHTAAGYVIHAVYSYDSDGVGADETNVFYRRSEDGGSTWSAEIQVNDDGTATDQWYPALGVSRHGIVIVSWYDRRLDPVNNQAFVRFADVSKDGGFTWGPNFQISDVTSDVAFINPNFDPIVSNCYHGDYDQIAVFGTDAHIIWSDDRRVTDQGPNPDVYTKRINLKRPRHDVVLAVQP